jgi:3-deoxy-D-manno-octulosonic-acid transferase
MYNLGIALFQFFMRLIAPFHKKAGLMIRGQRETYQILSDKIDATSKYVWIHCASLGEFEQARPVIEAIKKEHPEYKILLTFFSPSGYEVRKNYELADVVCYLPFDTKANVRKFLDLAQPSMAIFVKYEFWFNFIHESYLRHIPVYLISAIFRPEQHFFKKNSGYYGQILTYYAHIFVQDENSKKLLNEHGIHNVSIAGDTRFDRVLAIRNQAKDLPIIGRFVEGVSATLIAGSSWPPDEDIFIDYFNSHPAMKLVIAPHEIHESHLVEIERKLNRPSIRYSQVNEQKAGEVDCLIIDCFGLLSSIYRYGNIAYIGGGFGVGIHNLPEAAVYGVPVVFGPKYRKFREAFDLIEIGGGFSIKNKSEFNLLMNRFLSDSDFLKSSGEKAKQYIESQANATQKIMVEISF